MPIATIVTAASAAVSAVATLIGALLALRSQPRKRCRHDELAGTVAKKARRQKAVGAGSRAHKKKAERVKIHEAARLIDEGHYRAAILILNIPLECALREATCRAGIRPGHSVRPGVQMSNALFKADVLDILDVTAVRLFSEIYETAVTVSAEPPAGEARLSVELLKRILRSLAI